MTPMKILLADDHAFICEMLSVQLEAAGLEIVATAHDATEALAAARRTRPGVAVLDIDMPGLCVFDVVRQLRDEMPDLRVILLSAHVTDHFVDRALELEVSGYAQKTESLPSIVRAILLVAEGRRYFSDNVRKRIELAEGQLRVQTPRSPIATLTPREVEILVYVARGLSKKEIADLIHRSVKTVDQHCTNLMTKLEIHDRVDLARFAIREGIANP